jgi:hypothetical protein
MAGDANRLDMPFVSNGNTMFSPVASGNSQQERIEAYAHAVAHEHGLWGTNTNAAKSRLNWRRVAQLAPCMLLGGSVRVSPRKNLM